MISHLILNPVVAKYVFHCLILLRIHFKSLLFKALKSPVNRNWYSAYILSLLNNEIIFGRNSVRSHFDVQRLTTICTASNPDNDRVFADRSLGQNYPENQFLSDAFYGFATGNGNHPHLQPGNFSPFPPVKHPSRFMGGSVLRPFRYMVFSIRTGWFR